MATVPNWIAKGYAYSPGYGWRSAAVYRITSWRATNTQAVVTLDGLSGEHRFTLEGLRYAYRHDETHRRMILVAPDDDRVIDAKAGEIRRRAVSNLAAVIAETRLDASVMDAEELVLAIGRIQRAATKALADLAGVL
jgi:hypothetical protein